MLQLSKTHGIPVEPAKRIQSTYASGVIHLETRMTSFDNCTNGTGQQFMRIKDRDLAYATHPKFPDGIIFVPLVDQNLGCFIFKVNENVKMATINDFSNFARNIIDVSPLIISGARGQ